MRTASSAALTASAAAVGAPSALVRSAASLVLEPKRALSAALSWTYWRPIPLQVCRQPVGNAHVSANPAYVCFQAFACVHQGGVPVHAKTWRSVVLVEKGPLRWAHPSTYSAPEPCHEQMFMATQARRKTHEGDSKGAFVRLEVKLVNGADVILQLVRDSASPTFLPCQPSIYMAGCAFLLTFCIMHSLR